MAAGGLVPSPNYKDQVAYADNTAVVYSTVGCLQKGIPPPSFFVTFPRKRPRNSSRLNFYKKCGGTCRPTVVELFNSQELFDGSSVLFENVKGTRQEKDGSKVFSLTFVPMKCLPTYVSNIITRSRHAVQITCCRLNKRGFTPP